MPRDREAAWAPADAIEPWRRFPPVPSAASRLMRRPVSLNQPIAWWVLACAGLIPVLLTSAWMIAGAVAPASYDPVRQTVSALAGHAGTHRWIVTVALIAAGPCYFAVAAGITILNRWARIGLVVSGVASIGVALCPEPVVGSTVQHMTFTAIGASSIAVWPALTVQRDNPASVLTTAPVVAIVTSVFLAMLGWLVYEAQGGEAVGLVERLDCTIQVVWPFVVALAVRNGARGGVARVAASAKSPQFE